MSNSFKILMLFISCCLVNSCSKNNQDTDPAAVTTATYSIEMNKSYKVFKVTYCDTFEAYDADGDCITDYSYYDDSVVVKSDARSVTMRGDWSVTKYYLNNNGLVDSSSAVHFYGKMNVKQDSRKYYYYDNNDYLISDTTWIKDQNSSSFALSSSSAYEYTNGNNTEETRYYFYTYPYPPSTSYSYTYNTLDNLFSLNGSYLGKPNKNLLLAWSSVNQVGEKSSCSCKYKLNSDGLVEESIGIFISTSNWYKSIDFYKYTIIDKQ